MHTKMTKRGCLGYFKRILYGLALLIAITSGCAAPEVSPRTAPEEERRKVFQVVKHGWHVGIVVGQNEMASWLPLLGADFSGAAHLEIGWGDARFYQADEPSTGLALRAALWPTASVMHVVGFSGDPARYFAASEVVNICVSQSAYGRLLDFIRDSFARGPEGEVIPLGPGLYGTSRFYRAQGSFHLFNTCNTWAARAIAATGTPVATRIVTAGELFSQLRRNGRDRFACP
ncbi:MAG: DUF2459 domain-containing protein [Desulfobacterales bacterium]|nr:DUF2459 domain-containing protein [Desulfobacterales bacterium]